MEAEALLVVARAAEQQAAPDDAVEDDHHGGEHGVARQRRRFRAAGEHQRNDERDFDDGDRNGQHERAEGLAHAVRDHLGVVHGRQHAADQPGRDEHQKGAAKPEFVPANSSHATTGAARVQSGRKVRFSLRDYSSSAAPERAPALAVVRYAVVCRGGGIGYHSSSQRAGPRAATAGESP